MIDDKQTKCAYLIAAVGVALTTVTTIYRMLGAVAQPARPLDGNSQFGNVAMGNLASMSSVNLVGAQAFRLTNSLMIVSIIIVVMGLVWLGLLLLKSEKHAANSHETTHAAVLNDHTLATTLTGETLNQKAFRKHCESVLKEVLHQWSKCR